MITHTPFPSTRLTRSLLRNIGCALALFAMGANIQAATTDLATKPLTPASTVLPNLMFILDDSGSMDWTYMPDDALDFDGKYGYASSQCNGVYYNPEITYTLPVTSTGTSYATPTFTGAWTNGYNTGAGTTNLSTSFRPTSTYSSQAAFYYKYNGTQTSDDPQTKSRLQNYYDTGSTFYTECNTTPSGSSYTATITVSGSSATTVSSITVNGQQILDATTSSSSTSSTVASNIASGINVCTASGGGWSSNCTISGYSATASGSVVTITGPSGSNTYTPVITKSGSMTLTATAFAVSAAAPFTKVVVSTTSGATAAGMPADERQNFANWYSYYRTRMNMMKSASGIAFQGISSNVRVAYMSINNTAGSSFLNFATFDATQKSNWYNKLYAASPGGSTPLRVALSDAGRIYAKKLTSLYGIAITDPIQYSCQKNFTLLSTDGFWNGGSGYKVDGTTAMGNQDGNEPRPYNDGSGTTYTKTTTQIVKTQSQITNSTSQLQKTTTAYQTRTSTLQKQLSQRQTRTSALQKQTSHLQSQNSTLQTRTGTLQKRTCSSGGGWGGGGWGGGGWSSCSSWSSWSNTASCMWSSNNTECQYSWGSWSNASGACTSSYSTNTSDGTTWSGNGTACQYTSWAAATDVASCTAVAQNNTNLTAVQCPTRVITAWANTTSCAAATDVNGVVTECRQATPTAWSNVASCTDGTSNGVTTECQWLVTQPWATASTCTAGTDGSGVKTECQYTSPTAWSTLTASGSTATITLSGSSSTSVSGITVNGQQIMDGGTSSTTSSSSLASAIATQIHTCATGGSGWGSNCDTSSYDATASGSVVTITRSTSITYTPSVSKSGSMTATVVAFTPNTVSCTPVAQDYAHQTARECAANATTVGVSSCTPSTGVTCATVTTGPSAASSCTAASAGSGNNYTATTCGTSVTTQGWPTLCSTTTVSGLTTSCASSTTTATVSSCTPATASSSNSYKTITCSAPSTSGGTSDTLADVAEYYYVTDLRTTALGNCTSGSTTGNTLCAAPDANGKDLTYNNVQPSSDIDTASWQHMTTYTLGLGARGSMAYGEPNYLSDSSGDFYSVLKGSLADSTANPPICSWLSNGSTCNWPVPVSNTKTAIDDLWHTAVNGRGTYYSATDPAKLATALNKALRSITGIDHALAAPTLSNTVISEGDNFMFVSNFATDDWYSKLVRRQIDLDTGAIITDASGKQIDDWDVQGKLDTNASRTIYTYDSTNTYGNKLKPFLWANLTGAEQNYFKENNISSSPPTTFNPTPTTGLSQFLGTTSGVTVLTSTNKDTSHAAGENLVNFLRGVRTYEGAPNDPAKYYRQRSHLLGDIANSEVAYVKAPQLYYPDAGYGAFKAAQAARQSMIYVGANDGMLHAFYAYGGDGSDGVDPVRYMDTTTGSVVAAAGAGIVQVNGGDEAWAYIPSMLLPKLFTLADKNYANKHQFFVDGTPVTGDVCVSNCTSNANAVWKTILVGGLNNGGKGYYALDITNPAAPKALWEFTDTNMGYTYGKPQIVKLNDADTNIGNTWAVLVTSGYNNADGLGHLYVLNAATGAIIRNISTGVGSAATPSGLAQISAVAARSGNKENTVVQVYGGDLMGNVWRFDVNNRVGAAGYDAQLLATLKDSGGTTQPITTKPEVGLVDSNVMVYVGTGKYLGNNNSVTPFGDAGNTNQQTMYAIKDPLLTTSTPATAIYSNLRTSGTAQTMTVTTCPAGASASICQSGDTNVRTGTSNAVDLSTKSGWYIDLPSGTGERINTDPRLVLGTLVFNTNTPQTTACSDGASYTYFLDYRSGAPVLPAGAPSNSAIGKKIGDMGASAAVIFQSASTGKSYMQDTTSDGTNPTTSTELPTPPPSGASAKRTSWRELIIEQ